MKAEEAWVFECANGVINARAIEQATDEQRALPSLGKTYKGLNAMIETTERSTRLLSIGMSRFFNGMAMLGFTSKDGTTKLMIAAAALDFIHECLHMYETLKSKVFSLTAKETAEAATETAIHIAAQDYGTIIAAAAAAASVPAAFGVGYQFGSGNWRFDGGDISTPQGRREVKQNLSIIQAGGA